MFHSGPLQARNNPLSTRVLVRTYATVAPRVCCLSLLISFHGILLSGVTAQETKSAPPITINGVFESPKSAEIVLKGEQIKSWVIEKIVPHGTTVEAKQNVVWLKTDAIDKQIQAAEIDFKLAELSEQESDFKYEQFLQAQKLDRAAAERARERAREDYDHYLKVDRDYQLKSANFNLKFSEYALENVQEELDQLQKMYRQDELTEESEEIVLKRAQRDVESAQFRLEGALNQHARTIAETLPRNEVEQAERFKRAEMAYEAAILDLDLARKRRDLEQKKQKIKFTESQKNLEQLRAERKNMVLRAPVAGTVLHGPLNRGALPERQAPLEAGKSLTADQVILTIVPNKPLRIRLSVTENELRHVIVGSEVKVVPNLFPQAALVGTVQSVSPVPYSGNKFDCIVKFKPGKLAGKLIPTTGCRVEFPNTDPPSDSAATTTQTKNSSSAATADPAAAEAGSENQANAEATLDASAEQAGQAETVSDEQQAAEQTPQRDDPISGRWSGTVTAFSQQVATFEMTLALGADDSVTGSMTSEGETIAVQSGRYRRGEAIVVLKVDTPVGTLEPEFKLADGVLTATITVEEGVTIELRAQKQ